MPKPFKRVTDAYTCEGVHYDAAEYKAEGERIAKWLIAHGAATQPWYRRIFRWLRELI